LFAIVIAYTTVAPGSTAAGPVLVATTSASPVTSVVTRLAALEPLLLETAAPAPAAALEGDKGSVLGYTYLELGVAQNDVDDFDEDVDIFYGRASLNFLVFLYGFVGYSNQSTDFADTDSDQYTLGLGGHFGILPNLDLIGEVGGIWNDVSSDEDDLDGSEFGYRISAGARYLLLPWFSGGLELNARLGQINLDNQIASEDDAFFWALGVRAHFAKFLSVGAEFEQVEDDATILASLRFSL
jgi:hypothetical protein